jgi:hypothetical protein
VLKVFARNLSNCGEALESSSISSSSTTILSLSLPKTEKIENKVEVGLLENLSENPEDANETSSIAPKRSFTLLNRLFELFSDSMRTLNKPFKLLMPHKFT